MSETDNITEWLYMIVQNPGGDEALVGQYDDQAQVSFIPAFETKAAAEQALPLIKRDPQLKYEVQAIERDHAIEQALQNGFEIFVLDASGLVLNKIVADNGEAVDQ